MEASTRKADAYENSGDGIAVIRNRAAHDCTAGANTIVCVVTPVTRTTPTHSHICARRRRHKQHSLTHSPTPPTDHPTGARTHARAHRHKRTSTQAHGVCKHMGRANKMELAFLVTPSASTAASSEEKLEDVSVTMEPVQKVEAMVTTLATETLTETAEHAVSPRSPPRRNRAPVMTGGLHSLAAACAAASAAAALAETLSSTSSTSTALSNELVAGVGGGAHACVHCGRGFAQKLRLLHHLVVAHGETRHGGKTIVTCDRCESGFVRSTDLKKHAMCVHEKRRPHACAVGGCASRFFFAKDLKKHVSTVHERSKPYACGRCSQRFGKREHMNSHIRRVHDKLKPFHCGVCSLPLASKYNLQAHRRTITHRARVAAIEAAATADVLKDAASSQ